MTQGIVQVLRTFETHIILYYRLQKLKTKSYKPEYNLHVGTLCTTLYSTDNMIDSM